jgi:hypothetical protein
MLIGNRNFSKGIIILAQKSSPAAQPFGWKVF